MINNKIRTGLIALGVMGATVLSNGQCVNTKSSIVVSTCDSYTVPSSDETYITSGIYFDTIPNANGCDSVITIDLEINLIPDIKATVSENSVCLGDSVYFSGTGANVYNYKTTDFTYDSWFITRKLGVSTYVLEGTDTNGCFNTAQVLILVKNPPKITSVSELSLEGCYSNPFPEYTVAKTDVGDIKWYTDADLKKLYSKGEKLYPDSNKRGTTSYYAASDYLGCYSGEKEVKITVNDLPTVNAGDDTNNVLSEAITLDGSTNGDSYYWTPSKGLSDSSSLNPTHIVKEPIINYVLHATSSYGCEDSSSVQISHKATDPLVISNFLSPNGDGNNDTWLIKPKEAATNCHVTVFDGYGRIVFETTGTDSSWDGKFKGTELPEGDYYYLVECKEETHKGGITLLR